ncbi:hypothetical protein A4H97_29135 [Niastella yeongjuensis]|uniref:Carbohydrate-binding protein SusD n=1 Tax=Niastella yeongjuensis TaxID=354355 RepID=A0A1V9ES93_9BACT|nr:RagB/SusD family nutrient uptake outer membrane protein [Niastella yeongjuensis]OQP48951.1 hypothetical protein A4H97_29135 [Niastella yeongjuensis]SEP08761.1 Starch-binding associating with outer membrane [Niastella yeongjuensis]
MKRINKIGLFILLLVVTGSMSCHKLTIETPGYLNTDNFPQTEAQIYSVAAPVYINFRKEIPVSYWFLQSLSTDESILPVHGSNWLDGGQYLQLHFHTWNRDNNMNNQAWNWILTTISYCNNILQDVLPAAPDSIPVKKQIAAEVRGMRAMSFFIMMDLWGNIPMPTTYGGTDLPVTTSRKDVFNFIEKEVKEILPDLSSTTGAATYGRPTKYAAFALLAKMYLNAQVYTGTDRYNDAVAMCDSVITSNKFDLEADYLNMFKINNGPTTGGAKEFVFAVPFDNKVQTAQFFSRYYMHRSAEVQKKYSLPTKASGPVSTTAPYYAYFNDAGDQRNNIWLTGIQKYYNGSDIIIKTTKKGYDESYTGADGGDPYDFHLNLTPDVKIKSLETFDVGNDELAWAMGYRCIKYYPDSTSTTRNQSNDVPFFRYSDILLMKAEAILRGATATLGATPLTLVNSVRTKRGAAAFTSVDLEGLFGERCREFAWEAWHRNDMIRFGKFEDKWMYKTDADVRKRIFPIPSSAILLNPKLAQNDGYN